MAKSNTINSSDQFFRNIINISSTCMSPYNKMSIMMKEWDVMK